MNEDILEIECTPLPFGLDEKIFHYYDDEGNIIGEPYSYNDWIQRIKDISGVNEELLGRSSFNG